MSLLNILPRKTSKAFFAFKRVVHITMIGSMLMVLSACGLADRLKNVGEAPALSAIENPQALRGYRPVSMPMPDPVVVRTQSNSLWQSGSRSFFKDQRARQVGDILTVNVSITDTAKFANATSSARSGSQGMSLPGLGGFEKKIENVLPSGASASGLISTDSNSSASGSGTINRSETLNTTLAAVIVQVLPNGNFVINGRQEVRVNYEVRELIVAGIVRPEDIEANNSVESKKIAEARISYGGRGVISQVQQPRYGQQVLDIILPF